VTRRHYRRLPTCRRAHRSSTVACFWTLFSVSAGVGLHPLPIAAQTDLARLRVSPFLSPGPAQRLIGWAQSEDGESSGVMKGALIGAGIGLVVALAAVKIVDYCDRDNSPTYTCTIHWGGAALSGALAGAVIGAAIGAFTGSSGSSQDWSPVPRLGPSLDGGWALSLSIPSGGG
jgi:hypothetical protein